MKKRKDKLDNKKKKMGRNYFVLNNVNNYEFNEKSFPKIEIINALKKYNQKHNNIFKTSIDKNIKENKSININKSNKRSLINIYPRFSKNKNFMRFENLVKSLKNEMSKNENYNLLCLNEINNKGIFPNDIKMNKLLNIKLTNKQINRSSSLPLIL